MIAVSLSMFVDVVDKGETETREGERDVPRVSGRWSSLDLLALCLRNLGLCDP